MQQFINSADNSEINPSETLSIAAYTFLYQVNSHDFKRKELDQFSNIGYKFETNGATLLYPERLLRVMSTSSYSATDEAN